MRLVGVDPSGSSLDRLELCPAAGALPQVQTIDESDQSPRAKGSARHEFLDACAKRGRDAALAEVDPKHREMCEAINTAKLADRLELSTEVAIAYDWRSDSARFLQPKTHRAYEITDDEVPATLDVAAYDPEARRVFVGDYKGPRAWLPAPERSLQLGIGALALSRIYRADDAAVEYIRLRDDGEPRRYDGTLDVFGFEEVAARVRSVMGLVAEARALVDRGIDPNVVEGSHCEHCPARWSCPAKIAGMREVIAAPIAAVLGEGVPDDAQISLRDNVTPAEVASFYAKWKRAKDLLAQAGSVLFAYAKLTPVPLGADADGSLRFFGELSRPGNDVLDGRATHRVISAKYGPEVANEVVTMEATKKAIGEAVKKYKPADATQKAETEEIIAAIAELGGISNPTTTTTTEYTVSEGTAKARRKTKAA